MMHNGPSGVLSSCDLRIGGLTNNGNSSMVKQNQSSTRPYQHHRSDSSSSVCSLSLSPKASSPTAATSTATSTSGVASASTVTAAATDIDPQLAQHVEYELGLTRKNGTGTGTRKNAWGNLSYAELISKAITSSTDQRLTLSEIYDWMIKYVPFFRNKVDRISSAGWKNSIRHNLSLHNRFKRVQSEGNGKSSWWMINPDDKICGTNGSSTVTPGIKQTRRRLGHSVKSSSLSSVSTPKRLRAARSTKTSRVLTQRLQQQEQQQTSATQQIPPADMTTAGYDPPQWTTQSETDSSVNHPYEQELYSTSGNTSTTNSTGKSIGCIPSTYHYDDVTPNYAGNTSSNNNNNAGDYSYHHGHHFHHAPPPPPPPTTQHSHPQTLYQHHHGSNYDIGSTSGYYLQRQPQSVLNDHSTNPCPLSIDTYHPNNTGSYSLQQQIESNDEHIFLRVHSTSSHSSTASLSPPTLPTNTPHLPSSSSGSSSLTYPHPHKSSLSGGYLHPTSNETLTLYSHHHHQQQQQQQQQLSHHPHSHHSDIETLLQLNADDDDLDDDDDDLSTLVHHHHHHGLINDHQSLSSFYLNTTNHHHNNHPLHSHNDTSTSILRTVLKRPIVDMQNQQV